ncbi:hypothetical protein AMTRI_Chr10g3680 [Amborella trichopoda]
MLVTYNRRLLSKRNSPLRSIMKAPISPQNIFGNVGHAARGFEMSQSISIGRLVGARSLGYVWCFFHQSSGSTPYMNRFWFRGSSITKRPSPEWICGSTL